MLKVNDHVITPTIFPDGTSQVWKLPDTQYNESADDATVTWIFESEAELMHLAQLVDLLPHRLKLWLPYLPYARQDKKVSNESTFSLRTFARMLNHLELYGVSAFDPHSIAATDFIDGFTATRADGLISSIAQNFDYICYPDEGADKRYRINTSAKPLFGKKVRDQQTGKITGYGITNGETIKMGSSVLVVDDICDGGATFILLGSTLKCYRMKASLYVSHGIFSKGIEILKSYYDRIITTDSRPINHKELTVYESAPPHRLLQG